MNVASLNCKMLKQVLQYLQSKEFEENPEVLAEGFSKLICELNEITSNPIDRLRGLKYGQTNEKYKEDSRKSSTAYRKPITYSRASNFGSKNEMWFIGIIPWFDGLGRLRYLDLDSILQACIGIARFFCARFLTRTTWRREIGEKRAKQPGV